MFYNLDLAKLEVPANIPIVPALTSNNLKMMSTLLAFIIVTAIYWVRVQNLGKRGFSTNFL